MSDDPIQAEAERLARECGATHHTARIAAALRRQREDGAREEREACEAIVMHLHSSKGAEEIPRDQYSNTLNPFNLLLLIQGRIRARGEKP